MIPPVRRNQRLLPPDQHALPRPLRQPVHLDAERPTRRLHARVIVPVPTAQIPAGTRAQRTQEVDLGEELEEILAVPRRNARRARGVLRLLRLELAVGPEALALVEGWVDVGVEARLGAAVLVGRVVHGVHDAMVGGRLALGADGGAGRHEVAAVVVEAGDLEDVEDVVDVLFAEAVRHDGADEVGVAAVVVVFGFDRLGVVGRLVVVVLDLGVLGAPDIGVRLAFARVEHLAHVGVAARAEEIVASPSAAVDAVPG